MTGRELIKWIQDNRAEDLPVHVRHVGATDEEEVEEPEIRTTIVREQSSDQLKYGKYFLI